MVLIVDELCVPSICFYLCNIEKDRLSMRNKALYVIFTDQHMPTGEQLERRQRREAGEFSDSDTVSDSSDPYWETGRWAPINNFR